MKNFWTFKPLVFAIVMSLIGFCTEKAQAQLIDTIYKKDSTILYVTILRNKDNTIKYRYAGQANDSIFEMPQSDVDKITMYTGTTYYYSKKAKDKAKEEEKAATQHLKREKIKFELPKIYSPIYVDATVSLYLGLFSDVNGGYRFNEKHALGVSYIKWDKASACCSTYASGIGLQWRNTPKKTMLYKAELGYILNANYGDDGPYQAIYNYKKSKKVYQRVSAAYRFGFGSIGLVFALAVGQINDNFETSTKKYIRSSTFSVPRLSVNYGLAFPKFNNTKSYKKT
jgi:hypothetical protein